MAKTPRPLKRIRELLDVELLRLERHTVMLNGAPQFTYFRLSTLGGFRAESLGDTGWSALKNSRTEIPPQMKHIWFTLFAVAVLSFVLGVGW
ncbi:hypothetical protein ACIQU6_41015 [Streptomyces sp. NPDC090442]|uniref:hypothetical protein n=1 Tax=Streptomyces sp. NPDC090442 TaxID=3365962 RepID=UPI003810BD05